jgi:hypothetical protein
MEHSNHDMKDNYDFSKGTRGKCYRKDALMRLPEAIANVKREARASGLTDQEIDAELEAWRKERKANPSKTP